MSGKIHKNKLREKIQKEPKSEIINIMLTALPIITLINLAKTGRKIKQIVNNYLQSLEHLKTELVMDEILDKPKLSELAITLAYFHTTPRLAIKRDTILYGPELLQIISRHIGSRRRIEITLNGNENFKRTSMSVDELILDNIDDGTEQFPMDDILRSVNDLQSLKIKNGVMANTTAILINEMTTLAEVILIDVQINDNAIQTLKNTTIGENIRRLTITFTLKKYQDAVYELVDAWLESNENEYDFVEISIDGNSKTEHSERTRAKKMIIWILSWNYY